MVLFLRYGTRRSHAGTTRLVPDLLVSDHEDTTLPSFLPQLSITQKPGTTCESVSNR